MRMLRILLILTCFAPEILNAQSFYSVRGDRDLILTAAIGSAHYKGDLADPETLQKTRFNLQLGLEYPFLRRFSVRGELTYFRLSYDDAISNDQERKDRNLSFFSNNLELSTVGIVNLIPNGARFYQRSILNLYAFGGVGLLYFNPKTIRDNGEKVALQPIQTEGVSYSRFQPTLIGGAGVKYMVNPFINLCLEAGYRITFTDYLDDVSAHRYYDAPDAGYTLTDPLAIELNKRATGPASVRGNPDNKDGYLLMTLKVQYYLPYKIGSTQRKLYNKKRKAYYKNRRR